MDNLRKVESWFLKEPAPEFSVEIKHWEIESPGSMLPYGPHKWNIYVHINPKHPWFEGLSKVEVYYESDLIRGMPLHGGCTFFERKYDAEGKVIMIEIGCDYSHYKDDYYMICAELQPNVIADAQELWEFVKVDVKELDEKR